MWGGAVKNLLSYFFVAIHPLHHASDSVDETKNTRSNIIILPKNTAPTIITPQVIGSVSLPHIRQILHNPPAILVGRAMQFLHNLSVLPLESFFLLFGVKQ